MNSFTIQNAALNQCVSLPHTLLKVAEKSVMGFFSLSL